MVGMVILNYNDFDTTICYLKQISKYKLIDHIIVVDNNSSDDSYKKLCKYKSNKVDVILADNNNGYSSGNNLGVKYLRENYKCKYLFISNPDISLEENDLDVLIEDLKEIDVVAPVIKQYNGNIKGWMLPNLKKEINTITSGRLFKKASLYPDAHFDKDIAEVDVVPGCFFGIKEDVLKKVNDFDEGTFLYFEENILGYKLKKLGIKSYTDTRVSVVHNLSVSVDKSVKKVNKYKILIKSLFYYEKHILKSSILRRAILKLFYGVMLGLLKIKSIGGKA